MCDYQVMRLAFKHITDLMNPDECWPSKVSPWEAGHIPTPKRLPPQSPLLKLPQGQLISQLQKQMQNQSHCSVALITLV